jgi:hypothetical protein
MVKRPHTIPNGFGRLKICLNSDQTIEDTLDLLGTTVLWVIDFEEIPTRLENLYRSVGDDWDAVF